MLKFSIKTIHHSEQRYNTVGDYYTDSNGHTSISVSTMSSSRRELLVAVHEIVESYLLKRAGVFDQAIDDFDFDFEKKRGEGDVSEPGDDPNAPYYSQHQIATKVEKLIATILLVDWDDYTKEVNQILSEYNSKQGQI